jgi:aspartyl-tRNA(Asn)/glutamyl-tRNA(Gln) amidotransferase subunit A
MKRPGFWKWIRMKSIAVTKANLTARLTSSLELTEASLARSADSAGQGTLVFTKLFPEQARLTAQAVDKFFAAGVDLSPIAGLPISVKDLFDLRGETTTAGSVALKHFPASMTDAAVISRLKRAGAVIIGKTNMTEFAYSGVGINPHYGTPVNPRFDDVDRIPGGSSSGGVVSVVRGMALAAIVSDTGGSARIPAALCGVTGFKPTQKRIPLDGAFPLSPSLDSVGTIAPTVECCALLDAVLTGDPPRQLTPPPLSTQTFIVPRNYVFDGCDAHVARTFECSLKRLSEAGAVIVEGGFPEFEQIASLNAKGGFPAPESFAFHKKLGADFSLYDPLVLARILVGQTTTAAEYLDLFAARASMKAQFQLPAWILCPTVPIVAPPMEQLQSDPQEFHRVNRLLLRNPSIANFLDLCSLSIPCHPQGEAPVGMMLFGSGGHDNDLLSVGLAVEKAMISS